MLASDIPAAVALVDRSASAFAAARVITVEQRAAPVVGISHDDAPRGATEEVLARGMGPRSDKGDGDPNQDPDPPMA
jgi:hypothetical protein